MSSQEACFGVQVTVWIRGCAAIRAGVAPEVWLTESVVHDQVDGQARVDALVQAVQEAGEGDRVVAADRLGDDLPGFLPPRRRRWGWCRCGRTGTARRAGAPAVAGCSRGAVWMLSLDPGFLIDADHVGARRRPQFLLAAPRHLVRSWSSWGGVRQPARKPGVPCTIPATRQGPPACGWRRFQRQPTHQRSTASFPRRHFPDGGRGGGGHDQPAAHPGPYTSDKAASTTNQPGPGIRAHGRTGAARSAPCPASSPTPRRSA